MRLAITAALTVVTAATLVLGVGPSEAQNVGSNALFESLCIDRGPLSPKDVAICLRWQRKMRAIAPATELGQQLVDQVFRSLATTSDSLADDEDESQQRGQTRRRR